MPADNLVREMYKPTGAAGCLSESYRPRHWPARSSSRGESSRRCHDGPGRFSDDDAIVTYILRYKRPYIGRYSDSMKAINLISFLASNLQNNSPRSGRSGLQTRSVVVSVILLAVTDDTAMARGAVLTPSSSNRSKAYRNASHEPFAGRIRSKSLTPSGRKRTASPSLWSKQNIREHQSPRTSCTRALLRMDRATASLAFVSTQMTTHRSFGISLPF